MLNKKVDVYLSIGSNMKNRVYYLLKAILEIDSLEYTQVKKISNFYETEPWGFKEQENFNNIAIKIETSLLPLKLLKYLLNIEKKLDRVRKIKWGPRTIDIDIIFYDDLEMNIGELILPHPRFYRRNFVLKPLLDINENINLRKFLKVDCGKIEKIAPKVGISGCLLGKNVKYNGKNNWNKVVELLKERINFIDICPEVLGGMSTPRIPSEIRDEKVINKIGEDVTKYFLKGGEKALKILKKENIKTVILKSKSPSCGYGEIYDGTFSKVLKDGNGISSNMFQKEDIDIVSL